LSVAETCREQVSDSYRPALDRAETFGIAAPANLTVEGFADDSHPRIPVKREYVFRKEHLRDVLAFLGNAPGDGLYVTGPTGSGKTSLVI
jgi:cobaltochelatase CobS